jgi:4-alpha-glucanotransferase
MKIHFFLYYSTRPGESLGLTGNMPALGQDDPSRALLLEYGDDTYWHGSIEVDPAEHPEVRYRYHLYAAPDTGPSGTENLTPVRTDWDSDRRLELPAFRTDVLQVVDAWNDAEAVENTFFTQPFQTVFLPHPDGVAAGSEPDDFTHLLRVKAPQLNPDEVLCLLGHGPLLRHWDTTSPLLLHLEGPWWTLRLKPGPGDFPLSYKYGVWNRRFNRFVRFEDGGNRPLYAPGRADAGLRSALVRHDGFARLPAPQWRGAGVAIPVFSLRTEKSFGVGEFTDLAALVDWGKSVGLKMVQLLPVNDTTATHTRSDSYPYAAVSAFALHPLYLNLDELAGPQHAALVDRYARQRAELNALEEVDYETVMEVKWNIIRQLYDLMKADWLQEEGYRQYYEANRHWLAPYAVFCWLRDLNGTADFNRWPAHRKFSEAAIEKLLSPRSKSFDPIAIHLFVQYHLHRQLSDASRYAHRQGLALKGDIPIGIYRYSCDAWVAPELYNMDLQAGAPPDDFAVKGQNWGFPTYNWARMQEDGFRWWRRRFEQMRHYFDAFRIDHILGFFRIWSIPLHAVEGILGHFVPALALREAEFHEAGIGFDHDRLCRPYITDAVLEEIFGEEAGAVRATYLSGPTDGRYELLPAFQRQRAVVDHFNSLEPGERNDRLREGLNALIANVILLDVGGATAGPPKKGTAPGGEREYHFRIAMDKTASFRHLDPFVQQKLRELYDDFFFRRQDEFWRQEALKKLPELKRSTNMLVCGEDLGMVPACVPDVMRELAILSLEIQRMPKQLGQTFFHPKDAPYLSVVTPSTHDMSTIRGWWEENPENTQRFLNEGLGYYGRAPYFCEPWINRAIVEQHLYSPAMWSIFQLQDLLGSDGALRRQDPRQERINVPADPNHYWRYRMHLSLEQLQEAHAFNAELRVLIQASGRSA